MVSRKVLSGRVRFILVMGMILFLGVSSALAAEQATNSSTTKPTVQKPTPPVPKTPVSSKITADDLIGKDIKPTDPTTTSPDSKTNLAAPLAAASSSGPASPEKMNKNFYFDPYTGAGVINLPILAPAGRRGIQPGLSLTYSPRSGNGIFGMGWQMDFGVIERSTKHGIPTYTDQDTFIASLGGSSMELVSLGNGNYRPWIEGAFVKFKFDGTRWEARDKQGNTYYFGLDNVLGDNSRIMDPATGGVFRWYLSEVKDVHGNYFFIKNSSDGKFEVYYTGEPGTDRLAFLSPTQNFQYKVIANYEPSNRSDIIYNFRSGVQLVYARRIQSVEVFAVNQLMRRYDFQYTYSQTTGRSMLTRVTEVGANGTSSLPPITLTYNDTAPTYELTAINGDPVAGDHLFNMRFNQKDFANENVFVLYPSYSGDPNSGIYSNGQVINWSPKYTQLSYSDSLRNWSHGSGGDFHYRGNTDTAFYAWTYLYTAQAKTLNISNNGDVYDMFLNGNYNSPMQSQNLSLSLQKGYNLLEVTGYNQNSGNPYDLFTAIANNVDLMHSSQVLLPNLSGDFNGDGLADVATFFKETGTVKVALSNGSTFLPKQTWIDNFGQNQQVMLGDYNGDGKTDILAFNSAAGEWKVALSNGTQFVAGSVWMTNFATNSTEVTTGDMNGDGFTDIVRFFDDSSYRYSQVAINKGDHFEIWPYANFPISTPGRSAFLADFNGDGLPDFGTFDRNNGSWTFKLYVKGNIVDSLVDVPGFGSSKAPVIADFNNDGMADIGYYDEVNRKIVYRLSRGSSFATVQDLNIGFTLQSPNLQVQSSDYNGDGLTDFIAYNELGNSEMALSHGIFMDLLKTFNNGVGGVTTITYDSSSQYPQRSMPLVLPVVKDVTVSNSLGSSYTTKYSYADGYWDVSQREFYGFGTVKVIDADNNYIQTKFSQEDYTKGLMNEQAQYNAAGNLFNKSVNTWVTDVLDSTTNPQVKFTKLTRADGYSYEGNATGKRTAQEMYYEETPQMGNVTRAVSLGEVDLITGTDIGTDKRTVLTEYLNNTSGSNYLVGFPKHTTVKDNTDAIIRQGWLFYDNSSDYNVLPTKGLLTKSEVWSGSAQGSASNPTSKMTYDSYGNILSTTDANNNTSSVTYDTQFHMFPLIKQNVLNQQVVSEYYGVNGVGLTDSGYVGLFGLTKSVKDPNGQIARNSYDTFGRLAASVSPLDSITYPTTTQEYYFGTNFSRITTKARVDHGQSAVLTSTSFADGLGRPIQSKASSATAGQFIVNGQVEYNSRGLASKQYLPRFTSVALDQMDPIDTSKPSSSIQYDALGRPLKTINTDGTYADVIYDDWNVTSRDENGHQQKSYFDSYGRLIKKEEYAGADGRSPNYPSAAFTLYATTLYTYDSEGNLIQTKDTKNNITTVAYDKMGRKVSMDDPDMKHWEYGYDKNGNLLWQKDAKAQQINFVYDPLNRLLSKTAGTSLNVQYTYDDSLIPFSKGRLTKVVYGTDGKTEFFYDSVGREIRSKKTIGQSVYEVQRSYDALNRLKSIKYPNQKDAVYQYNNAGQIKAVADDASLLGPQSSLSPTPRDKHFTDKVLKSLKGAGEWLEEHLLGVDDVYAQTVFPVTLEAENMPTKTTGGAISGGWMIWSNGYVEGPVSFPSTGSYEIEIIAYGSIAAGVWPNMEARVDQGVVGNWTVNATSWTSYKKQISVTAGTHNIAAAFTNDYYVAPEDRNLFVDKIIIRQVSVGINAPTLNAPVAGNGQVALSWSAVSGATGYKVYFGTQSGFYGSPIDVGVNTTKTITGLTNGTKYYFAATAYNASTESGKSNEVNATPQGPVTIPNAPVLNTVQPDNQKVNLSWSSIAGATGYKVKYRSAAAGATGTDFTKDTACVGAWKLEETSGNFIDSCKTNTGAISGTLNRGVTGKKGKAVEFLGASAGNNALVNFGSAAVLDKLTTRTITAWIKPDTLGDGNAGVIISKNYQDGWTLTLYNSNAIRFTQAFSGGVVSWRTTTSPIQLGQWQHIAVTYAGNGTSVTPQIYFNGVLQSVTLVSSAPFGTADDDSSYNLNLGVENGVNEFDGMMDEVAIFTRVLTSTEINTLMNNGLSGSGTPSDEQTFDVGNVTQSTVVALTNGTAYYFSAAAYNSAGQSAFSNEISATPVAAAIQSYVKNVEYNASGQITKMEYANGVTTTYSYNPLNLRLTRLYTTNTQAAILQDLNYTYDSVGNILKITDNAHTETQTFTYDALNRLASANGAYGNKTYSYDQIGNIVQKDGLAYTYGQNGAGPHAVTALSDGTTIAYDTNGNMTTKTKSIDTTQYVYDVENRLAQVKLNGTTLEEYQYDGDGGRVKKTTYGVQSGAAPTCFLAGTPVLMADGSQKPIEQIKIGEEVLGYDEQSLTKVPVKVTQTFEHQTSDGYLVINGTLAVTPEHPFYSAGEWKKARDLKIGDRLLKSDLSEIMVERIEKSTGRESIPVYNVEVDKLHNYFANDILVHNKLSFTQLLGGQSGNVEVTNFVGSLYEESTARDTRHIFFGDQRISSLTNGKTVFYHGNHLGSTNILTDSTGVMKELNEYEPYGRFSKHEKYGTSEEMAWNYFTGQRLDDKVGLYYYGARYYDPSLGRFITPDSIVPRPGNPQEFNRYSYVLNNPVNRTDPSGHKSWWSRVWGAVKDFARDFGGLYGIWGNVFNGIVNNNWQPLQNQVTAGATAFITSGFNPVAAFTAVVTAGFIDSKPGRLLTNVLADEVYDDMLGFHPSTAHILATIDISMTGSYISDRAIASAMGKPVQTKGDLTDKEINKLRGGNYIGDEEFFGPSLKSKDAQFDTIESLSVNGEVIGSFQKRTLNIPILKQLGAQHSSANALNISAGSKLNPWTYATWGVCHQATNATLLSAGVSSTILDLGATWDMYVTTAVYGSYGGQLGNRVWTGVNANKNYEERGN